MNLSISLVATLQISQGWILGPELCDIWTSCDVLCCTASILHLVAIAVDRYWAVTNIDYIHSRTSNRVFMMIFCVWTAAVIVSLAPQFGWKDPDYLQRIEQQKCMVSQDVAYQVFATCCTFYVPLLVILALYWKIYQTARKRIHRRRPRPVDVAVNNNQPDSSAATATDTKLNRLRLRLGRFSTAKNKGGSGATACGGGASGTALGLVEGNSTNTVNTVEDTEFSSSNVDSKSRAGIEAPSTSGGSQIATVSHLVALAKQQGKAATKPLATTPAGGEKATESGQTSEREATTTTATSAAVLTDGHNEQNQANGEAGAAAEAATASASADAGPMTAKTSTLTSCNQAHPLCSSVSSVPVTPETRTKQPPTASPAPTTHHQHQQQLSSIANPMQKVNKRKETLEAKRERKAAKTLAIITGAFVVCWLPFFVMALTMSLCKECEMAISDTVASLFLWLGYFNSTLNPVIYTIFSPEFRQAFKRILFGGHRPVHYRSGKL
ncbi:uncharacterized protein Dwil_GK20939 [Drosophila willistoni]|uniref:G-protein coupled receptors family 1 profile domain-containing protein n=1 Tax=Drosophila willistoni TaxID=7260 RepID=B4MK44_DROWI|nr:uncharacterized protein Dwil_GK20939 [Drosophila willistoni]